MYEYVDNEMLNRSVIGYGLSAVTPLKSGKGNVITGVEKINECLHILIHTRIGEKVNNPNYGTRVHEFIFEVNDYTTVDALRMHLIEVIGMWEKRIDNVSVVASFNASNVNNGKLPIKINYRIKRTGMLSSFYTILSV